MSPDNIDLDAQTRENDEKAKIARLATLNPLQYDRQRAGAAEELGVTVSALDKAVKEARSASADTKGQGRAFELPTIEPWPSAVDGADLLSDITDAIKRHVVLPANSAETVALWALQLLRSLPAGRHNVPGKAVRQINPARLLECLVARPLPTGNATVSSIFRIVELASPTPAD
jgi:putative DNA primase/helicase